MEAIFRLFSKSMKFHDILKTKVQKSSQSFTNSSSTMRKPSLTTFAEPDFEKTLLSLTELSFIASFMSIKNIKLSPQGRG